MRKVDEIKPVIYKITSPSGKVYIGQTWAIYRRINAYQSHNCKAQTFLYNSLCKYGWKNHLFEIIIELPVDVVQTDMDRFERVCYSFYEEAGFKLLNLKEPGKGGRLSQETRDKISLGQKGRKLSEEHKSLLSDLYKGVGFRPKGFKLTEEHKEKLSIINKGRKISEKQRQGMDNFWKNNPGFCKGRIRTEETRLKLRAAFLNKPRPKEIMKALHDSMKKKIVQLSLSGEFIKTWEGITEAAHGVGLKSSGGISAVCTGERNKAGNFKWKYYTDYMKQNNEKQLISNKAFCKFCGETIESFTRHDYVSCGCGKSAVDGGVGAGYIRLIGEAESTALYNDDVFELVRQYFFRSGYGPTGKGPWRITRLYQMSDDYLQALLEYDCPDWQKDLVNKEIQYRKQHNIKIEE